MRIYSVENAKCPTWHIRKSQFNNQSPTNLTTMRHFIEQEPCIAGRTMSQSFLWQKNHNSSIIFVNSQALPYKKSITEFSRLMIQRIRSVCTQRLKIQHFFFEQTYNASNLISKLQTHTNLRITRNNLAPRGPQLLRITHETMYTNHHNNNHQYQLWPSCSAQYSQIIMLQITNW